MKPTLTAKELGLRPAVAPVGIAAFATPLRGVPGVYRDDPAADSLSLVLQEVLELGKAPGVKPAFSFATRSFSSLPDVGEVFHNESRTRLNAMKNRGGKHVVAIPSEALFTPSEASKVPSGRLSAFSLQITSKAKDTLDYLFHMSIAMKPIIRGDGRSGNSQVNPDGLAVIDESNVGQANDNMKVEMTLATNKVGGGSGIACRIISVFRKAKRYLQSALSGGEADNSPLPVYFEGMQIVPWRTGRRLRASNPKALFIPADSRPHRLAGFMYRLNVKVGDEVRQGIFTTAVHQAVKRVGIAIMLLPACTADSIKRLGELVDCLVQSFNLFSGRLEQYSYRPVHIGIIPHIRQILQGKEVSADSSVS